MPARPLTAGASLVVALLLTGCASAGPTPGDTPTAARETSATMTATSEGTTRSAFPLWVSRIGGIAGFDDRVTVTADGLVTGTTRRSLTPRQCRLDQVSTDRLASAAAAADWASALPPTTDPRMSDQMFTTIGSPLGGPASISDPGLGDLRQLAAELLALGTTGTSTASLTCTPVR